MKQNGEKAAIEMSACWASCLGNCADKITREHLVSENLFLDDEMTVEGFPWCKGKPVKVGLASLTAKILCEQHNSDLSEVDTAGGQAFDALREARRVANIRERNLKHRWSVRRTRIDGRRFERWCLKTLINLCCDRENPIGRDSAIPGRPSERLVRMAYGLEPFPGRAGLYFVARVGMNIKSEDRVSFAPLISLGRRIEGGLFAVRGQPLLLFLEEEGPPGLTGICIDGEDLGNAQVNYHIQNIKVMNGKYLSEVLIFKW
jgi:hypothetical protein